MRALVQRVTEGSVLIVEQKYYSEIKKGMVILLGVKEGDTEEDLNFVADKCSNLRIFEDENEKMNLSLKDINGEVLIISQFTLYGDARKGNRPSFTDAARPDVAESMYEKFIARMKSNLGNDKVKYGVFGAMMMVKIFNDGPVTILLEP
ncbi:MAG: D-aminoacyl-tRNA deacylase [Ignavibacteriales bacterium]|nr:D-aminoacyl-tRNA deacylase [Ignavibacteriales bacterium]